MKKIHIGIIGCGTIAQIMHLPFLHELRDYFEISAVCDLSSTLANYAGDKFGVSARYTNYEDLLGQHELDAVAVLTLDPQVIVLKALQAGKHVFVEKPLAHNVADADQLIDEARRQGAVLMVGYMKRYDPGFEKALEYFREMKDNVQLIRMHLLGAAREKKYALQLDGVYTLTESDDVPLETLNQINRNFEKALSRAIDSDDPVLLKAYRTLLMVCCHDSNIMRAAFGEPDRILFTDICHRGESIVSVLEYADDVRCVWEVGGWLGPDARSWWDEYLIAYGKHQTVQVVFPHSHIKYAPTMLYLRQSDRRAVINSEILTSYEEAFRREWLHFHDCVVNGREPRTNGPDARTDIALLTEMVKVVQRRPS